MISETCFNTYVLCFKNTIKESLQMSQSSARRASGRRTQRKTAKPNRLPIIILIAGLVIIMVVAGVLLSGGGSTSAAQQFPNQVANVQNPHIQSLTDPHEPYNSNPPTSGWHYGATAPWGVQTQPIPDEITVHNLEHGGVIIHYRQDLDKATVDQLTTLTRELQQQSPCILLVPRPNDKLDVPIAVTSWTWLLKLQQFDAGSIRSFLRAHVDQGPEKLGCQLR